MKSPITFVRIGRFSGSAISLRDALAERVAVEDVDLSVLARLPAFAGARMRSMVESLMAGGVPTAKTSSWSVASQRWFEDRYLPTQNAILFNQTLPAFDLPEELAYGIYTDRVALEGSSFGGKYSSVFSSGWLKRERLFLAGAERIYVMGPRTKEFLIDYYAIDEARIAVTGAGPNVRMSSPAASNTCKSLLFVGTKWDLKGGPELLEAFQLLRRKHPEMELLLVGDHPGRLPDGVIGLGRVPIESMGKVYLKGDVLVLPSHAEAFTIALIEALYYGIPCVAGSSGHAEWIIQDAGCVVEPGSVVELAKALQSVVEEYPYYKARAMRRRSTVMNQLSWSRVSEIIVDDLVS